MFAEHLISGSLYDERADNEERPSQVEPRKNQEPPYHTVRRLRLILRMYPGTPQRMCTP